MILIAALKFGKTRRSRTLTCKLPSSLCSWRQGTLHKQSPCQEPGTVPVCPRELAHGLIFYQPMGLFRQTNHIHLWEPGAPSPTDLAEPAPGKPLLLTLFPSAAPCGLCSFCVSLPGGGDSVIDKQLSLSAFLSWCPLLGHAYALTGVSPSPAQWREDKRTPLLSLLLNWNNLWFSIDQTYPAGVPQMSCK